MIPEFLLSFSIYFEFEFTNEWTFECWMECGMNVCKPDNSSFEIRNFSSNINMQKKYCIKCWTGLLRRLPLRQTNTVVTLSNLLNTIFLGRNHFVVKFWNPLLTLSSLPTSQLKSELSLIPTKKNVPGPLCFRTTGYRSI